jgi:hypothetical protein
MAGFGHRVSGGRPAERGLLPPRHLHQKEKTSRPSTPTPGATISGNLVPDFPEPTVHVLHAVQKKAKRGIKTPKLEVDMIQMRFEAARAHHEEGGARP